MTWEPHNHFTRDIKPRGKCPACDAYWQSLVMKVQSNACDYCGSHFTDTKTWCEHCDPEDSWTPGS